ncbi:MAG: serine/threonine-protein kinase [Fimbriiglobus sp.]
MPPPVHVPELLDRVRMSGLCPIADVEALMAEGTPPPGGWTPPELLERLVAWQLLTTFQADRIAAGKYKGFVLGSYVILDRIGGGGMGQVFLAEHAEMRRLVALKVLSVPNPEDTVARERFLREARAAAALNHPHIIKVFDLNRESRMLYLVMEYLPGLNLQEYIGKHGPLSLAAAASIAHQVALGLGHAHEMGLVHRDIKPSNIIIDATGTAKILDLGLVRSEADVDSRLTAQYGNAILGTADYLAPEQAVNSSNVDIRADLYSLGATLYFLLAGRPLFPEGRTAQKLMWQQWKEPEELTNFREDLPSELVQLVKKSIAKQRENRFQTPAEFVEALAPFVGEKVQPPAEFMPIVPQRRWMTRTDTASSAVIRLESEVGVTSGSLAKIKLETRRLTTSVMSLDPAITALKPTPPPLPFPKRQQPSTSDEVMIDTVDTMTPTVRSGYAPVSHPEITVTQPAPVAPVTRNKMWQPLAIGLALGALFATVVWLLIR